MKNENIDIQCEQILNGILSLEDLLKDPLTSDALALSENVYTNRNRKLLVRLKNSLTQYLERGKDLFYIGFVGHFSTGKSSSINSLLSLEDESDKARRVGLNPVDTMITLITHSDNQDTVFNGTTSSLGSVGLELIEHDFLRDIVIADTPGVGDPVLASKITKDFLPICDFIIYFFSAANPLDDADVPLLKEKQSHLPFIPIKFVVTRAEEFKKNRDAPLTNSNFDKFKSERFVETLSYRLNNLIQQGQGFIGAEDVILVDNIANFNVNKLRDIISEFSDTSQAQTKIFLHSHKVEYFKKSARDLRNFFSKFVARKLVTISEIVKTAEENVARFQNTVQVANNGLTKSWNEKVKFIDRKEESTYEDSHKIHSLPSSLEGVAKGTVQYNRFKMQVAQRASERNKTAMDSLSKDVESLLKSDFLRLSRKIDGISFEKFEDDNIEFKASLFSKKDIYEKIELIPSLQAQNEARDTWKKVNSEVSGLYTELKKRVRELTKCVNNRQPIRDYDLHLESASKDLLDDFDTFFESIRVYRSSMFSMGVRSNIATLGLEEKLDLLEKDDFSEDEKAVQKQEAREYVFPGGHRAFERFSDDFDLLAVRCKKLIQDLESLSANTPINPYIAENIEADCEAQSELDVIHDTVLSRLSDFERNINIELRTLFDSISSERQREIIDVRRLKRQRFFFSAIVSTAAGLVGYYLFLTFRDTNLSDNIPAMFAFGLLVNVFTNVVGFLFTRMTSNLPSIFSKKERTLVEKFRSESRLIIESEIENFVLFPNKDSNVYETVWLNAFVMAPLDRWEKANNVFYEQLKHLSDQYNQVVEEYSDLVAESSNIARGYFSSPQSNLDRLREISDSLKERAIEPSFALLARTRNELETVNTHMEEISFT